MKKEKKTARDFSYILEVLGLLDHFYSIESQHGLTKHANIQTSRYCIYDLQGRIEKTNSFKQKKDNKNWLSHSKVMHQHKCKINKENKENRFIARWTRISKNFVIFLFLNLYCTFVDAPMKSADEVFLSFIFPINLFIFVPLP